MTATTRFVPIVLLVLAAFATGCSQARNTPEQALAQVKQALKSEQWELLYDLVPPDLQKAWDDETAKIDAIAKRLIAERGADVAAQVMKDQIGVSLAAWEKAGDARKRFALNFAPTAKRGLAELGVNTDEVLSSAIKSSEVKGDVAYFSLDDGKGHRSKLRFKLISGLWRFDLEQIKKEGGG